MSKLLLIWGNILNDLYFLVRLQVHSNSISQELLQLLYIQELRAIIICCKHVSSDTFSKTLFHRTSCLRIFNPYPLHLLSYLD